MNETIPGRLKVNWDSYWQGFMTIPCIEAVRIRLIEQAYQRLLRKFSLKGKPRFCELGAGTASVSRFLADQYQADTVIVDSNAHAITLSQKTFADFSGQFTAVYKDVFDLDEFAGQFDLVHSGGLIEHFSDETRDRILKVHCDLVKEDGCVLILVPIENMWYRILNYGIFKYLHLLDEIAEIPWSLSELSDRLKKYNFEIVAKTTVISELGVLAKKRTIKINVNELF